MHRNDFAVLLFTFATAVMTEDYDKLEELLKFIEDLNLTEEDIRKIYAEEITIKTLQTTTIDPINETIRNSTQTVTETKINEKDIENVNNIMELHKKIVEYLKENKKN